MEKLLVLDASVAIKAILPNTLQGHCRALVGTFAEIQPVSLALWAHETTSAISKTVHFGQVTEAEGRQALEQLASLGVQLFTPNLEQNQAAFDWTIRLKRAAAYDSYYLPWRRAWIATSGQRTAVCSMRSRMNTSNGCIGLRKSRR